MKSIEGIGLRQVQEAYSGPEGDLWELLMGEQIHVGGFRSSSELLDKAGISPKSRGIDFCCGNGAGMRYLIRFHEVEHMIGVDATPKMIERARQRCTTDGVMNKVRLVLSDVCNSGLPSRSADFVWGEDAWCYVADKNRLLSEAERMLKPGGIVAFTDWLEGPTGLSDDEAERLLRFMKFPNILNTYDYCEMLIGNGLNVRVADDTGRFASHVDLYLNMVTMQLTYDTLRVIGFDPAVMQSLAKEMMFLQQLAHQGKIAQGIFIADKPEQ